MADTKKRLGRGLNSLLSSTRMHEINDTISQSNAEQIATERSSPEYRVCDLPIEDIRTNPHQPRNHWDEKKLFELADSIKINGLIQPVIVRPMGDGYQLIAGERRLRAVGIAGKEVIPAIIKSATEDQMLEWALVENIHRADLNPLERAQAYQNYISNFSLTQNEASVRLGEDRSTIANYMRLLELPQEIKQMLSRQEMTMGHARALLAFNSPEKQIHWAHKVIEKSLSVRELEKQIQAELRNEAAEPKKEKVKSAHLQELENEITQSLGTRVSIRTSGRKGHRGKIVIEFYNLDDFDRIREKLL